MNDPVYQRLLEQSWKRKLSADEQAQLDRWLALNPDAQAAWDTEAALNDALAKLPEAEVSSNFTARVLQAVQRETAVRERPSSLWKIRRWLPRVAFAALIASAGLTAWRHEQIAARRAEYAQSVEAFSDVASLPSPEVLQNFEAIRHLNQVAAPADEQLLTLLQ